MQRDYSSSGISFNFAHCFLSSLLCFCFFYQQVSGTGPSSPLLFDDPSSPNTILARNSNDDDYDDDETQLPCGYSHRKYRLYSCYTSNRIAK